MSKTNKPNSLLEVSQQQLADYLTGDGDPRHDPVYAVARACLPHTLAAVNEINSSSSNGHLNKVVSFLREYGIFGDDGPNTEYYQRGRGWDLYKLADLMRANGSMVAVQNLTYGPEADIEAAVSSGRVRSEEEKQILKNRMQYGGEDKSRWLGALTETLDGGGQVVPIIEIPRMDGQGASGHSVLIIGHNDGMTEYFDSDGNARSRYEYNDLSVPDITRIEGEERLFYKQPDEQFLERMTGEVIHIYSNQTN